jgi:hypothetical protein
MREMYVYGAFERIGEEISLGTEENKRKAYSV